jgi:hypothetical protein
VGYYFQKDLSTLLVLDFFGLDGSISICEVEVILGINRGNMGKSRLEAFSDGVIAILYMPACPGMP